MSLFTYEGGELRFHSSHPDAVPAYALTSELALMSLCRGSTSPALFREELRRELRTLICSDLTPDWPSLTFLTEWTRSRFPEFLCGLRRRTQAISEGAIRLSGDPLPNYLHLTNAKELITMNLSAPAPKSAACVPTLETVHFVTLPACNPLADANAHDKMRTAFGEVARLQSGERTTIANLDQAVADINEVLILLKAQVQVFKDAVQPRQPKSRRRR